jgi:hypothetical protein
MGSTRRRTSSAIDLPYDSITEVRRVTGADMRPSAGPKAAPR